MTEKVSCGCIPTLDYDTVPPTFGQDDSACIVNELMEALENMLPFASQSMQVGGLLRPSIKDGDWTKYVKAQIVLAKAWKGKK